MEATTTSCVSGVWPFQTLARFSAVTRQKIEGWVGRVMLTMTRPVGAGGDIGVGAGEIDAAGVGERHRRAPAPRTGCSILVTSKSCRPSASVTQR